MKPIYLKMENFGSYKFEEIDFSKVENGIFLVTGDTGSGKTTIFDAISYALFDTSSGGKRNSDMMLSQFSEKGEKTKVSFKFKIYEDVYEIERMPRQLGYKKKIDENGKVTLVANKNVTNTKVSLKMPDGEEFSGSVSEINNKIKEILGIDAQQFGQIAMLAQGDFLKLLQAKSEDRKEIFAKIFDTSIYRKIEENLKIEFNETERKILENQDSVKREVSKISFLENSFYKKEELIECVEREEENVLEIIDNIILEYEKNVEKIKEENEKFEKETLYISQSIERAYNINSDFKSLEVFESKKKVLEEKEEGYKNALMLVEKGKKAKNVEKYFLERENRLNYVKEIEKEIEKAEIDFEKNRINAEDVKEESLKIEEKYKSEYFEKLQKIAELKGSINLYDEIEEKRKEIKDFEEELKKINKEKEKTIREEKEVNLRKEEIKEVESKLEKAKENYSKIYKKFIENQAIILRESLKDGDICPVCNNIYHKGSNEKCYIFINEENLKEEEKRVREIEVRLNRKKEEINIQSLNLATLKEKVSLGFKNVSEKIEEKRNQLAKIEKDIVFKDKKDLELHIKTLEKEAENLEKIRNDICEKYQKISGELQKLDGIIGAKREDLKKGEEEFKKAIKNLKKALEENNFINEEEYKKFNLSSEEMEKNERGIENYKRLTIEVESGIKIYREKVKGKEKIDIEKLEKEMAEVKGRFNLSKEKYTTISNNFEKNKEIRQGISELLKFKKELIEKYLVVKNLYKTACGKIGGKKINFQTYVQRIYFKKVINAANKRLLKMNDNQFSLVCRDIESLSGQGFVGLDLDVYSFVNNDIRDVKSLSGGESFIAALSMALGLSDIIKCSNGKVKIDTIFIDEGFGSLSEEARNKAISLLNQLGSIDQLIGIISHVSELKEQIENKLVIEKDSNGSHARWSLL